MFKFCEDLSGTSRCGVGDIVLYAGIGKILRIRYIYDVLLVNKKLNIALMIPAYPACYNV